MTLDDRLRSAATSLRRGVDAQVGDNVPELSARRTTRRRRVAAVLGIAVVALVGSGAALLRADDSNGPSVQVTDAPTGSADEPIITVTPATSAFDAALGIQVTGLPPGQRATVKVTSRDVKGVEWTSRRDVRGGR